MLAIAKFTLTLKHSKSLTKGLIYKRFRFFRVWAVFRCKTVITNYPCGPLDRCCSPDDEDLDTSACFLRNAG